MKWKIFVPILLACLSQMSCTDVKDPEFRRVEKFGVRNLNFQNATIGFQVTYYNPNNFGVTVKEAEADVYLDSVYLGKFIQSDAVNVQKAADFSIPFSGKISLKTALNMNLESLAKKDVLLKADGSAKIGKAGIYVTKPIRYQGMHRLDEIKLY